MHIAIVVYPGFDELDAIGPYEVFKNAASLDADLSADLYTLTPADRLPASHGLRIEPDEVLDEADADLVVVPGGGWNDRAEQGAWAEAQNGDLPDTLVQLYDNGTTVAGVCTGGMIVATAGLTENRPATTHAGALEDLRETNTEVIDARVVDDGDLLTAGGVTSGLDLALWIVERESTPEIANRIAQEMEYDRREDIYRSSE
jgi:transcriptional regulator GlxA family with amidase domain